MILKKEELRDTRAIFWQDREIRKVSMGWHANSDRTLQTNAEFLWRNVFNTHFGKTRTQMKYYMKIIVIDIGCENAKWIQLAQDL
jgi:hypothetical protein